jgi:hypothetical protein
MQTMLDTYEPAKGYGPVAMDFTDRSFPVRLYQNAKRKGSFAVQYGKQFDYGLSYSEACEKLGQVMLHVLSCDGMIDNEQD